jgi:hypothetical protein
LGQTLRDYGLIIAQQYPAGRYNIDIALTEHAVAVEVVGVDMSYRNTACAKLPRVEYLLNQGWWVVFVLCQRSPRVFDSRGITEQLIAITQRRSRTEPSPGQYGMIRGDGQPLPRHRGYGDNWPYIFDA